MSRFPVAASIDGGVIDQLHVLRAGVFRVEGWTFDLDRAVAGVMLEVNQTVLAEPHAFRVFRPDVAEVKKVDDPFLGYNLEFVAPPTVVRTGVNKVVLKFRGKTLFSQEIELDYVAPAYGNLFNEETVWTRDRIYGQGEPIDMILSEVKGLCGLLKGRVLDFGSGNGALVAWLLDQGLDAHGIELDSPRVRRALPERLKSRITLYDGNFPCPYPDNSFDGVIATEVIEHVPDYAGALAEIARLTDLFIITVPDMSAIPVCHASGVVPWHLLESTHFNFFTQAALHRELSKHFSSITMGRIGPHQVNGDTFYGSLTAVCRKS